MTPSQAQCLAAIRRLTVDGVPPTWDDLRVDLGLASKSGVHHLLVGLRDRGLIAWTGRVGHSLVILEDAVSDDTLKALPTEALQTLIERIYLILGDRKMAAA